MTSITRREVLTTIGLAGIGASVGPRVFAEEKTYKPAVPGRPEPPASPFGFETTAEEVTAGMDLTGMTALVTGCNSGLGLETMRVLALRGAHVYGAARTLEKAETACDSVDGRTTPIVVELTDPDTIVSAGEQVKRDDVALDMLVLNAGIMALQELEQVRGIEKQFAVNHLGHFLLTEHLPRQCQTCEARTRRRPQQCGACLGARGRHPVRQSLRGRWLRSLGGLWAVENRQWPVLA